MINSVRPDVGRMQVHPISLDDTVYAISSRSFGVPIIESLTEFSSMSIFLNRCSETGVHLFCSPLEMLLHFTFLVRISFIVKF